MRSEYIVAEISKTWIGGKKQGNDMLSNRFDDVIKKNVINGYNLVDWKLNVYTVNDQIIEMIIAVFALPRPLACTEQRITY